MSDNTAYVYLLRDPRVEDPVRSVFYVGKGTGLRALDHAQEARQDLVALAEETQTSTERVALSAKLSRINEIEAAGHDVAVDVLASADGSGITDSAALDVEAALIALLRMTELGNKVKGHKIRLMTENAFSRMAEATLVDLPESTSAITVSVSGVWGGQDYAGTLLGTPDAEIWDNARQIWPSLTGAQDRIRALARTEAPAVLIALAKHPSRSNIVVGVYELVDAVATERSIGGNTKPDGGVTKPQAGWEFHRCEADECASTTLLRSKILGNTLAIAGEPVRRTERPQYLQGIH